MRPRNDELLFVDQGPGKEEGKEIMAQVTLTENAAQRILTLMKEEASPQLSMFRIMIFGGGCSGFQYQFTLDNTSREDDHLFDDKGVKIAVDEASLALIEGCEIDYTEDLMGASFHIKNPNASSSCGCGSSFSV